jgi:nucleolar protein 16
MLKKMPAIRGPQALQEAWDRKKTVKQNYEALGLVHTLNPSLPGGVEPRNQKSNVAKGIGKEDMSAHNANGESNASGTSIPSGFGQIMRDEAGNVIGVQFAEEDIEPSRGDVGSDPAAMQEVEIAPGATEKWVTDLGPPRVVAGERSSVIDALEKIASTSSNSSTTLAIPLTGIPRHTAGGERVYLQNLRDKYGDDVDKMAKDRKLNYQQRTCGELRRALRKAGLMQ